MPLDAVSGFDLYKSRKEGAVRHLRENVPEGQFDLTSWCGCFLGWLGKLEYDGWTTYSGTLTWDGYSQYSAAVQYFGITTPQAWDLFSASSTNGYTAYGAGRERKNVTLDEVCNALLATETVDAS